MSAVGKSNSWEVRRCQEKPKGKAEAWIAESMRWSRCSSIRRSGMQMYKRFL